MQFKLENQLKCKAITDTFNIIQANKAAIRSHYIAIKLVCNRLIAPNVPSDFWWPYGQEYFYFVLRKKILTVIIYLSSFFFNVCIKEKANKQTQRKQKKEGKIQTLHIPKYIYFSQEIISCFRIFLPEAVSRTLIPDCSFVHTQGKCMKMLC